MNTHQQHGFTLLELLIVIAIIGILSVVLVPNLVQARARSHNVATMGFLREIASQQLIHHMNHNTYASSVHALDNLPIAAPQFEIISESGDYFDFCVAVRYMASSSAVFHITAVGRIAEGDCS
jgi:prepilin-type N-terminal cleavage/methylation domain-containing protein